MLPKLKPQIWILAGGRLLSEIGTGFTLFYAPIFFVNQIGISSTLVGLALGSGSVAGVVGRFLGGQGVDSPAWGRRKILLLAAAISAFADVFLVMADNFLLLVVGNMLMGLGVGLYWPATEAAIIDLADVEHRNESFAVTRLADSLGLSLGVVLGGALIANFGNYRALFAIDGVSFVIFFGIIYYAIAETYQFSAPAVTTSRGWRLAFSDRSLMIYAVVNILFTVYLAQVQTTLPLYLKNFAGNASQGFSEKVISGLFSWHITFAAICQLPIARWLNRFSRIQALTIALIFWGIGFFCVWRIGTASYPLFWSIVALGIMALGMVTYTPSASAFVADIAPESLRGVYLSISSQCWAIGYFIGPAMGGYILDRSESVIKGFWLGCIGSIFLGMLILYYLAKVTRDRG
ncbi:MAG TPA: MFS transporter [Xenococcaceae cyanobacterium]|jgi:MFS family permease